MCNIWYFGQWLSFMGKYMYGNFENWPISRTPLPVERKYAQFRPLRGRKRLCAQHLLLWAMAKFHSQIWQFWKSPCISETATCRAKIHVSSILTPWNRERVYVQLLTLWPMAKFHAQIWQFGKWARISETAAHSAKISSILCLVYTE